MDVTLSGRLKMYANNDILEDVRDRFIEADYDELTAFVELMGDAEEDDIEVDEDCLTIPFDQSYDVIKSIDYSKSVVEFMKKLAEHFPDVEKMTFEGRYEAWSSGEFMNFLCKYADGNITIFESDDFDDLEDDMIFDEPAANHHRKDLDTSAK